MNRIPSHITRKYLKLKIMEPFIDQQIPILEQKLNIARLLQSDIDTNPDYHYALFIWNNVVKKRDLIKENITYLEGLYPDLKEVK